MTCNIVILQRGFRGFRAYCCSFAAFSNIMSGASAAFRKIYVKQFWEFEIHRHSDFQKQLEVDFFNDFEIILWIIYLSELIKLI